MREKKFLDTVHGYISVPETYCDKLVDTRYFQRLRRIEQTSARSLFPCARHDRFVHSLGVFHLGRKIVASILRQVEIPEPLKHTFQIACLLHDCGHSPFSHTLEELFGTREELFEAYKQEIHDRKLDVRIADVDIADKAYDTKQHEILSALLSVTVFYERIIEFGGNPSLVGRMIMGIPYNTIEESLEDCFISLLHGDVIDADKLDYICRDKWASGYLADSVDLDRLIDSIVLHKGIEGRYKIAYSKSSINEIQALIDSKNFQTNWVFLHHQVVYEQKLLKDSVTELVKCLQNDGQLHPQAVFNYKAFYEKQLICGNPEKGFTEIYMPADDDIVYLMKVHHNKIPHLDEWLSRNYKYFPMWKSHPELVALLGNELSKKLLTDKGAIYDKICNLIDERFGYTAFALDATPRIKEVKKGQIDIQFAEDSFIDYADLGLPKAENVYKDQTFKYLFVKNEVKPKMKEIVEGIKKLIQDYGK